MAEATRSAVRRLAGPIFGLLLALSPTAEARAQNFDFARLEAAARRFSVILRMQIEFSFGMQTNEHEQQMLAVVVSADGLAVFDGGFLNDGNPFEPMSAMEMRATPTRIEAVTLDEKKYDAEFLGVDRFTGLGFVKINTRGDRFEAAKFVGRKQFKVGEWLALYTLLPEFVSPRLTADIALVSAILSTPEEFTLTVGFNPFELASVLFDESGNPVGVLGALMSPTSSGDSDDLMGGMGQMDFPLLGVVPAEKLNKLIAEPPKKGKIDRAWLGITLQALTPDIAEFIGASVPGGIVVNEVVPDSPADRGGLVVGDVIFRLNNQPIEVDREEELAVFQRQIANMGAGASVELAVLRPSGDRLDTLTALVVLDAAPLAASEAEEAESTALEFNVREMVFADYVAFDVNPGELSGVVVSELKEGGLAYVGGLRLGDVIQRIDNAEVASVNDFTRVLDELEQQKPREVILFIWRFNQTMFVNVKTDWN